MALVGDTLVALPVPDGYNVDLANPQRQGQSETYSVVGVGVFLGCCFMAQRIYTKLHITKKWQIEDCMFPSLLGASRGLANFDD